jgi:ABC-type multidrug transport system fused ATPase/permease subunit
MKIKEYRRIKLAGKKKVANFFVSLGIAVVLYALVIILIPQILMAFLEINTDNIVNDLISASGDDLIKIDDSKLKPYYDNTYQGNPCNTTRKIVTSNTEFDSAIADYCKNNKIMSYAKFKEIYLQGSKGAAIQQGTEQLKQQFADMIKKSRNDLQNLLDRFFFLNPWIMFALLIVLLGVYFYMTDAVIFIDYVFRKIMDNVLFLVIIPYIFFNTNLLGFVLEKMSAGISAQKGTAIPSGLISEVASVLEKNFSEFYNEYMFWAVGIFAAAIGVIVFNRYYLLPKYAEKLTAEERKAGKKVKDKKEEDKEEKAESKAEKKKKK